MCFLYFIIVIGLLTLFLTSGLNAAIDGLPELEEIWSSGTRLWCAYITFFYSPWILARHLCRLLYKLKPIKVAVDWLMEEM
jgi:hypothetical protein